ncbi:MAG: hypothetical protein HY094_04290 [Candidatus Melainabacteria bacterium]|nr:hypothetical protein [Candidatus Melainabacteria bacterium]
MNNSWKRSPYIFELCSFKLRDSNKWRPQVMLKNLISHVTAPLSWDIELNSAEDANEYAENRIFEYLESNLYNS